MSITFNNYESWFLDYHEGKLNEDQKEMVLLFLEQNAKLLEEFNAFDNTFVLTENFVLFEGKENLKAPEASDFDTLFVAYIENELNPEQKKKTNELIRGNKKLSEEFSLFKKTVLKPDMSIRFTGKKKLKKGNKGVIRFMYYTGAVAAAACVLFFSLNFSDWFKPNNPGNTITHQSSDTIKSKNNNHNLLNLEPIQIVEEIKKENKFEKENKNSFSIANLIQENNNKRNPDTKHPMEVKELIKTPMLSEEKASLAVNNIHEGNALKDTVIEEQNDILFASNSNAAVFEKDPEKTEPANEFLTPKEMVIQRIRSITSIEQPGEGNSGKISFWEIADVGSYGISKLTGKKFKVSGGTNNKGEVASFAIVSDRFGFSHSTSK
ncbi:MAG: hypothetical protein H0V01_15695 [Bacteroidetes bacterium]|nr:hypothetical protein [Bacteroidota bacterium]HET6244133.1 hypothetical protein [Bacteroidia bacterium]